MLNNWGRFDYSRDKFFGCYCLSTRICFNLPAKSTESLYNPVEKLCKRLSKKLRLCCEKNQSVLCKTKNYVIDVYKNRLLHRTVEKFYLWFSATNSPIIRGFTQFPHSLLLQLLFLIRNKEVYEN